MKINPVMSWMVCWKVIVVNLISVTPDAEKTILYIARVREFPATSEALGWVEDT